MIVPPWTSPWLLASPSSITCASTTGASLTRTMLPFHRTLVLSVAFPAAGATLRNMVDSVTRNPPSADAPAAGRPDGYLGVSEAARLLGVNREVAEERDRALAAERAARAAVETLQRRTA